MKRHFIPNNWITITRPMMVDVVGCGGTGSILLHQLARQTVMFHKMDHPGLYVRAWDPKRVTDASIGRQLFYDIDMGQSKADVLIKRINRNFGFTWKAFQQKYEPLKIETEILLLCLDDVESRISIMKAFRDHPIRYEIPKYVLDCGNTMDKGQVIIGSFEKIHQPKVKETEERLLMWDEILDKKAINAAKKLDKTAPSCSTWEAVNRQDPHINYLVALYASKLIWDMLKNHYLTHQGYFINDGYVQPIPVGYGTKLQRKTASAIA